MKNYLKSTWTKHAVALLLICLTTPLLAQHQHEEITADKDIAFLSNQGQWYGNFSHVAHLSRYSAFLMDDGLRIGMSPSKALNDYHALAHSDPEQANAIKIPLFGFDIRFIGATGTSAISEDDPSPIKRNYFLGNDQNKWHSGVRDYASIIKADVWPGIDIVYTLLENQSLEFDYLIEPGADISAISWQYLGVDASIKGDKIVYGTPYGSMHEFIPQAYQIINGRKVEVDISYRQDGNEYGFTAAAYDESETLIIDPVIVASTLTGTVGNSNYGHGATYDEADNIFSFGRGFGPGLPTTPGVIQPDFNPASGTMVVINKFNPTGTEQIFATYLGGSAQSLPHSAVTNFAGELYIFGSTLANDFPVTTGALQTAFGGEVDIFVSRISPDGTNLMGSTYLGGSQTDGYNQTGPGGYNLYRGEVNIDTQGNIYVASATNSTDFPATSGSVSNIVSGLSDGMVAKLSADLNTAFWVTLLGGSDRDSALGVRATNSGNVIVAGASASSDYPTTGGAYQTANPSAVGTASATVSTISSDGSTLLNSTYVGTESNDLAYFLDLDNNENVWIYGSTDGGDAWPISDGVFNTLNHDLFITQLSNDLSTVMVSNCIGSNADSQWSNAGSPVAFLVDRCDKVYISCYFATQEMPITPDAIFPTGGFYLAVFEDNLETLSFGTYYTSDHVDGGTSRFNKKGIIYQGVCSGGNFNTNPDAFAIDQDAGWDVGVFKIDFELSGVNAAISAPSELDGCVPHTVQFSNFSIGDTYSWDFGDGSPISTEFEPSHEYTSTGTFDVQMIASDSLSCNLADTVTVSIDIFSPTDFVPSFEYSFNCDNNTAQLQNTTGGETFLDFYWIINGDTLYTTYNASHAFANVNDVNTVALYAVDEGCDLDEIIYKEISPTPDVVALIDDLESNYCGLDISLVNGSINAANYLWEFGDGTTSTLLSPTHIYADYGTYDIVLTAINPNACNFEDQIESTVTFSEPPALNTEMDLDQLGKCSDLSIQGLFANTENMASITWLMYGEEIGSGSDFSHQLINPGTFVITAEIVPVGCPNIFTFSDEITVVAELPIDIGENRDICFDESQIEIGSNDSLLTATYLWTPGGQTTPTIMVGAPDTYSVAIATDACTEVRTIEIGKGTKAIGEYSVEFCEGLTSVRRISVSNKSFTWDHGLEGNLITLDSAGTYGFTYVDLGGCTQTGELEVTTTPLESPVFIPNSFSPNGDGINDLFRPVTPSDLDYYSLEIYNRWGKQVFYSEDRNKGWNGSSNDNEHYTDNAIYQYIMKYSGSCQTGIEKRSGAITLMR